MRIIKLILFTITLALACSISYGQAPTKVAFGGTRPIDTAWAGRHLRIDSTVRFLKYSTSDATKYLRVNASGFLELGTPAGGGGNADSATFFTNYRADTMRSNIYGQLALKGSGTVTNVSTGFGMLGGPITTTGTVQVDSNAVLTVARGYKITDSVAYLDSVRLADTSLNLRAVFAADLADTASAIRGAIPSLTGYVPYTGATTNVDLGNYSITAADGVINHPSGSGVALSVTKGGNGEAVTVNKTSGSGNAMSVSGGVTLLSELHTTTAIADAYIASAATWNAKGNGTVTSIGVVAGTGVSIGGTSPITTAGTYTITNTAPDQTVSLTGAGTVSVTGTYPTFTVTGTGGSGGVTSITSTGSTMQVTGTTTVNVEVDTTHNFTFTGRNTFTRDITIDSVVFGTGNGLSTNIKIGRSAFAAPTTATGIVAIGENAGRLVTTGQNDIYIGRNAAGNSGTAVSGHVGIGTGNLNYSTGDNNTAIGFNVMARAVAWSGIANVGVGINAGNVMTTATANTFVGSGTAAALTSGGSNTFLGVSSGSAMTTGSSNVILGGYTGNVGGLDIRTSSSRMVLSDGAGNVRAYHNATNWLIGTVTDGSTGILQLSGSLGLNTAGNKLNIATGSQASVGTGTLATGTATILTTAVTANSIIQVQLTSCSSCGTLYIGTVTAGTSFVVNSTNGSDASTFNYWIIN